MQDFITRLRQKLTVEVIDRDQSWEIRTQKADGLLFEIVVPHGVLEWFVTARTVKDGREVWSDWIDYYSLAAETQQELRSEMEKDVERFIDRLLASKVRVVEAKTFLGQRHRVEWKTGENWKMLSLHQDAT